MCEQDQGVTPSGPGLRPFGVEPATQSQAEPLVPNAALFSVLTDLFENPLYQVAIGGNPNMVDRLMDRARLALAAYREPRSAVDEGGWLIEESCGGIAHWIALEADAWPRTKTVRLRRSGAEIDEYLSPIRRVKDASEALRFARKVDADAAIALLDRFLLSPVATEHCWIASAMSAGTAETAQQAQGQRPASAVPKADARKAVP